MLVASRVLSTAALAVVLTSCAAPPPSAPSGPPPPAPMLRLEDSGVYGNLYLPAGAAPTHAVPAVLLIGGSEGGLAAPLLARTLADRGFAVLAVAYFAEKNEPRLPATLADIPARS